MTARLASKRPPSAAENAPNSVLPAQARVQNAQREHWAELYDQHARFVAWFASRLLSRREEVEDVVQDVFVVAAKNLDNLANPAQVRGWLKTVAIRSASRKLRFQRVRRGFGLLPPDAIDDAFIAPESSPEAREDLRRLHCVLVQLPVALRLAWTLRHLHQEELESVACVLGCSLSTAKRRIAAAQLAVEEGMRDD